MTPRKNTLITLKNISLAKKENKRRYILRNINLKIEEGDIISIIGRTGSGKTAFMKILAGLKEASSGTITFSQNVTCNMVFQHPVLLPWLNVWGNIELGILSIKLSQTAKYSRMQEVIHTIGLRGFETYYPRDLSEGMQQRVAIARALVSRPSVLLLDEPFRNLDVLTAESLWQDLLQNWYRGTLIFITNDAVEAVSYATKIITLSGSDVTGAASRLGPVISCSLPFPRNPDSAHFKRLLDKIYALLSPSLMIPAGPSISTLPLVEVDEMIGLLISMRDYPTNRVTFAVLSEDLDLDLDALLEVIYCLSLLKFILVLSSEAQITDMGLQFLEASSQKRREILGRSILDNIGWAPPLVRLIEAQGTLSFEDGLRSLNFSNKKDGTAVLNIFLKWAIYAELIQYEHNQKTMKQGKFFSP